MEVEQVLVIPAAAVTFEGFATHASVLEAVAGQGFFIDRRQAEVDESIRQVIPYVVVRDGLSVFGVRRLAASGEARLHDKLSIGIGGHINPVDGISSPADALRAGLLREWDEEMEAGFSPEFSPVGFIADNADAVGRVHVGVVMVVEATGRPVAVRETDKLEGRFFNVAELSEMRESLEGWSLLVARKLLF